MDANALRLGREELVRELLEGGSLDVGFAQALSGLVDAYFRESMAGRAGSAALVAVGGYGRAELCPGSDVDVLLLVPDAGAGDVETLAGDLFRPVWDAGFDLGHGVRAVDECLELGCSDNQVLASLLDARLVAGNEILFQGLRKSLDERVLPRAGAGFAAWLHAGNAERERLWGRAEARMEPDLKNGPGGLRDFHQVAWLARVLCGVGRLSGAVGPFSASDVAGLKQAMEVVLRARMGLHVAAGRKRDKFFLELQPRVAELAGCRDKTKALAVEGFLAELNAAMSRLVLAREAMFREKAGLPELDPSTNVPRSCVSLTPRGLEPDDFTGGCPGICAVLELFGAVAETGLPMSWAARAEVSRVSAALDRTPGALDLAHLRLAEVLMADATGRAGRAMLDSGFLGALMPEFGRVRDLVQFDAYHVHPLGAHSLKTVRLLAEFFRDPDSRGHEAASGVARPETLVLAGLLHDVGKGGEGDHAVAGARIAADILARFGADAEMVSDVSFLVEHHLLLPEAAARTRLSDHTQVAQVASQVGSVARLDMLYLLSMADAEATGPRADSQWSRALLAELYFKLRWFLQSGPLGGPHAVQRILAARDKVRSLAREAFGSEYVERCLAVTPPDYLQARRPEDIARDLDLLRRFERAGELDAMRRPGGRGGLGACELAGRMLERHGCFELAFAVQDRPGLFATLAGVLALFGMDVHSAELYTLADGTALDLFIVDAPADLLYLDDLFARLKTSVSAAITGKLDLEYRLEQKRSSLMAAKAKTPMDEPQVRVDNQADEFFTLVEVTAPNRPGLLHDIAKAMRGADLDVGMATISTCGDMVRDVFRVRDESGQKLENHQATEKVRQTLLTATTANG